jgi:hypothetical protein
MLESFPPVSNIFPLHSVSGIDRKGAFIAVEKAIKRQELCHDLSLNHFGISFAYSKP